jgi:hypothetical protein
LAYILSSEAQLKLVKKRSGLLLLTSRIGMEVWRRGPEEW